MKTGVHPTYNENVNVVCACGNTFSTGSTLQEIRVEICSNCHPFYTGKQKFVDTQRRLDRFQRIIQKKSALSKARVATKAKQKKEK